MIIKTGILTSLLLALFVLPAKAQYYNKAKKSQAAPSQSEEGIAPSPTAVDYAKAIAKNCPEDWEDQDCLEAVSENVLAMASQYAAELEVNNKKHYQEAIKEHCAAATAATKGAYPAYALQSAYTECANKLAEITDATNIAPDQNMYQLLIGAVLCLGEDRRCNVVEAGLKKFNR